MKQLLSVLHSLFVRFGWARASRPEQLDFFARLDVADAQKVGVRIRSLSK
jgi:hypothetical protein